MIQWFKKVFPNRSRSACPFVMDNLRYAVGGYFKAQFKNHGSCVCDPSDWLCCFECPLLCSDRILIAVLDFLPFFGTGTAMIPWAIYKFFMGDYKMTVILVIFYVVTQLVRQLLQPKLVGDSMGAQSPGHIIFTVYRI